MENNYETLRMPELKALARERRLRNYSQLRKAYLTLYGMGGGGGWNPPLQVVFC